MVNFLKNVLKGLLYVLFFPLGIIAICLFAIFGVFVFIYRLGKLAYLFFTGRSLKNELPEDEEVRKLLKGNEQESKEEEKPALNLYPSDQKMYQTDEYVSPTFEDKKEEENIEELKDVE